MMPVTRMAATMSQSSVRFMRTSHFHLTAVSPFPKSIVRLKVIAALACKPLWLSNSCMDLELWWAMRRR